MVAPALDQYFGLLQRVEDLRIQQLVPELAVEAFVVSVLPRAAGLDVERLHPDPPQPVTYGDDRELGSVVRADMVGRAILDEELRDVRQDALAVQLAVHMDGQTSASIFVDDRQHPEGPSVMGPIHDEVIGPDVVRAFRPEPDAGAVIQP